MAATQLEFSAVYLSGLTLLGFRFTRAEREAVMHLWRYVGMVMGVDDRLMPRSYDEGVRQMLIHGLTNPHADHDSRALAKALHGLPLKVARSPAEALLAKGIMRYRTAISRFTLGGEAVDDIGLPAEPLMPLLVLPNLTRFALETLRRNIPGATSLAARAGLSTQQGLVKRLLGTQPVQYVPYAERAGQSAARLLRTVTT